MTQTPQVAILTPLVMGTVTVLCTILIHAVAVGMVVHFVRRELRLGYAGVRYMLDFGIVVLVNLLAFTAHLIDMAIWAQLFLVCGEFHDPTTAYYHSAVNYTTLGYGDLIMSPSWKLLGPIEAADGALMFGVSTAMVFAVIQRLLVARFIDLKE